MLIESISFNRKQKGESFQWFWWSGVINMSEVVYPSKGRRLSFNRKFQSVTQI